MCGIAGLACKPGVSPDPTLLKAMSAALRHRGPDGMGEYVTDRAALCHRRLSIIDLAGGAQPLTLGSIALVANGEIYNDPALRQSLPDIHFRTGSDCETPLALWPRLGVDYPAALRGMYAIALLDGSTPANDIILSRDPFGIKPLYIATYDGGIAFASEPQALLSAGIGARAVRPEIRDQLLAFQFTFGCETIYPGIRRLAPGETLRIVDGRIVERKLHPAMPPRPAGPPLLTSEAAALEQLDRALIDTVTAHERADVPFGLFLSGGIDSSALLAAMVKGGCQKPRAWTARFDVGCADESRHAAEIAAAAGARHEILTIDDDMLWRDLPRIVAAMDDPVADYAIIPTWFLARAARAEATVILSGEGGDELFAGYGRYRRATTPWWRGGKMPHRKSAFRGRNHLARTKSPKPYASSSSGGRMSHLERAQASDISEWLPNDLLIKLDRCLMAHGLEGRTPLLDPVMAGFAATLPDHLKIRNGQGKYLLRRWLQNNMPAARPFAPKQGFTVPIGTWIAQKAPALAPLVSRNAGIRAAGQSTKVQRLFEDAANRRFGRAAWHLLFYALWHRIHIEGASADGDVFDTLATH